jgi:hypothetical protein
MLSIALYTSQVLPAPRFQCLARQPLSGLSPARHGPRAFTPTNGLLAVGPPPKPLFISASHSARPRTLPHALQPFSHIKLRLLGECSIKQCCSGLRVFKFNKLYRGWQRPLFRGNFHRPLYSVPLRRLLIMDL